MNKLQQQKAFLVTTEFVFLEVADALSAPAVRAQTIAFISLPPWIPRHAPKHGRGRK